MRVLITGGAGFIGSHLAERLLAHGHRVRVLDNLSTGKRTNLPVHDALEFMEGDVRDREPVEKAVRECDAIVHLAAVASVQASIDDPQGTHASNFLGTLNLLEASHRAGVRRFLYASSAAVYGDAPDLPVSEEARLNPLSPYAADKLAGEHYLFFYARRYDIAATAFRFFNIYGPRQDPHSPYSGVISVFVNRACAGQPITLFGDGEQTRDFVYVADLAEILNDALEGPTPSASVVNVGRGVECSLMQLLRELERIFGRSIERRHAPVRVGDIRRSCANVDRLRQWRGGVPVTALGTGLARLVEFSCR